MNLIMNTLVMPVISDDSEDEDDTLMDAVHILAMKVRRNSNIASYVNTYIASYL